VDEWACNLASFVSTEALRLKYNLRAPIVHEKILAQKYFALMRKSGSLRNRFRKPADLSIFTAHNHPTPSLLEQNLSFLGVEHTVLKPPLPVWSNSLRVQSFVSFLENCSTRYVLYCDSDDVILREDPARIMAVFESHDCDLLYCSTNYSAGYLNMPAVKSWVEEQHPNRYLNAGVFIGRTAFALEVYKCVLNYVEQTDTLNNPDSQAFYRNELSYFQDFPKGTGCDQAILRFLEPRYSPRLRIDSECRLVWRHAPAARLAYWPKLFSHKLFGSF